MEILKVVDIVKHLLIHHPMTQDSDELLTLKVWAEQNPKLRNKEYPFMNFAINFKEGAYHKTESIRRSRQKLQEEFPNLRGKTYKARQGHQEQVKEDLKTPEINAGGTP